MRRFFAVPAVLLAGIVLGPISAPGYAQTPLKQPKPGFNLFTVEQDIEIGRQSAVEAEQQLRLLNDATVDRYLDRIVQRLAANTPGGKYPYRIKAVNASEINAFALPGGPMYVHRGLIEAVQNEAELAGVLAHEMSHVALRHGTNQASKAYLAKSGLGLLGGLAGRSSSSSKILNTIGGVGLNAVFLKYSRGDEYEADQLGAQIMHRAGYDPLAMASMFEKLRAEQGRNPSKLEQFFSSHPSPANRETRIRQAAASLGTGKTQLVGNFANIRSRLTSLPATSTQQVAQSNVVEEDTVATGRVAVNVPRPSSTFERFEHPTGFFTIEHPDNWQAYPSGHAVSMAPEGGVVNRSDGRPVMLYGVVVNHYVPFESAETRRYRSMERSYAPFEDRNAPRGSLEDATDDLIRTILDANPYLRVSGSVQSERIDQSSGFSVLLSGQSPVTGEEERVTVYTRGLPDGHVIYLLSIVPGSVNGNADRTFERMLRTLSINDAAAHRASATMGQSQRP